MKIAWFFKKMYYLMFGDIVRFEIHDDTWREIFMNDRPNNADKFRYTNLGKGRYLKRPKLSLLK
jgi:hypothetical protein